MKKYRDGSFKGVGLGYAGEIKVFVTVVHGKIHSIEFLSHSETPVISEPAFNLIPTKIIEKNTIMVPNVKGCSMSSRGIKEAVMNALVLSGKDKNILIKELTKNRSIYRGYSRGVQSKIRYKFK